MKEPYMSFYRRVLVGPFQEVPIEEPFMEKPYKPRRKTLNPNPLTSNPPKPYTLGAQIITYAILEFLIT